MDAGWSRGHKKERQCIDIISYRRLMFKNISIGQSGIEDQLLHIAEDSFITIQWGVYNILPDSNINKNNDQPDCPERIIDLCLLHSVPSA